MDPRRPAESAEATDGARQLDALRRLLLAPEQDRIERLDRRLDDLDSRTRDVAEALPAAVRRSQADGPELGRALAPIIDAGLREAVRRDPQLIVDVVYPVLGPIIRKSVANSIRGTIESLNRVVEHSFTWRGLKWRMEAMRTGESVAEVALRHSLLYRVEQVFLIHRETGLPLESVSASGQEPDEELVTGMLTAIQDFVRDSFSVEKSEELDRLEVGDFQVWIERGPRAALAAVIRGSAPRRLRGKLADVLGEIHGVFGDRLAAFDGDPAPFEATQPDLEDCLEEEHAERRKSVSPLLIVVAALLFFVLAGWLYQGFDERRRWSGFLADLRSEPGVVLVEQGRRDGRRFVSVMRDPLAREPSAVLAESEAAPADVLIESRPFLSLDEDFAQRRAREFRDSVEAQSEAIEIDFAVGVAELNPSEDAKIIRLAMLLQSLDEQEAQSGSGWIATVVGSSDSTGSRELNEQLRNERADAVRRRLVDLGVPQDRLRTRDGGLGGRAVRLEIGPS